MQTDVIKQHPHFMSKFGGFLDMYFTYISDEQLKDEVLWKLLIRQFRLRSDDVDDGWRGEFWGKLMRGGSMVYAYSGDEELYAVLKNAVEGLLREQDEEGRISTYSREKEFSGWDMWSRKYVMLGLEFFYEICREEPLRRSILDALERHARYIMRRVGDGDGQIPIRETSKAWGAVNSVSILQPIVKLYRLTGDADYLSYAEMLIREQAPDGENIFRLAYKDEIAPGDYPITKAYEIISCFEGMLELYGVTGRRQFLETCVRFADRVLKTEFTVVGGSGCEDEFFDHSTLRQVLPSSIRKQETCVTVTLMKYLANLYRYTGNSAYIDAIETSFLNLYLGALNTEKNEGYLIRPIFYSYSPVYRNPRWTMIGGYKNLSSYAESGCCVSIGAAGIGILPQVSTVEWDGAIVLNLFFEGSCRLPSEDGETAFSVRTGYPYDGNIQIEISKLSAGIRHICLRKAAWCESYRLLRNGRPCACREERGYIIPEETVAPGDTFDLQMELPVRVIPSESVNPDVSGLYALAKGPIVLCADSADCDLEQSYPPLTDENGHVKCRPLEGHKWAVALQTGGELPLREYRFAGKDYYEPRDISAWLRK